MYVARTGAGVDSLALGSITRTTTTSAPTDGAYDNVLSLAVPILLGIASFANPEIPIGAAGARLVWYVISAGGISFVLNQSLGLHFPFVSDEDIKSGPMVTVPTRGVSQTITPTTPRGFPRAPDTRPMITSPVDATARPLIHETPMITFVPTDFVTRASSANAEKALVILIAEDDPDMLNLVALKLRNLGFTVITAESADEALEKFRAQESEPDAVLTDYNMPGQDPSHPKMNGGELITKLRELSPNLPIAVLSNHAGVKFERDMLERGAMAVFDKFKESEAKVLEFLRGILERAR